MIQQVAFTKEDYLEYQLYTASKSKRVKQNRIKNWLIISGSFLLIGVAFYQGGNNFMAFYFAIVAVISLIFYPFYQRKRYKDHYRKYVNDIHNYEVTCDIEINSKFVHTKDITGESKMNISEVVEINETGKYFFVKFSSNQSLILPKHSFNYESLFAELSEIASLNNMVINKELDWKWK